MIAEISTALIHYTKKQIKRYLQQHMPTIFLDLTTSNNDTQKPGLLKVSQHDLILSR